MHPRGVDFENLQSAIRHNNNDENAAYMARGGGLPGKTPMQPSARKALGNLTNQKGPAPVRKKHQLVGNAYIY